MIGTPFGLSIMEVVMTEAESCWIHKGFPRFKGLSFHRSKGMVGVHIFWSRLKCDRLDGNQGLGCTREIEE